MGVSDGVVLPSRTVPAWRVERDGPVAVMIDRFRISNGDMAAFGVALAGAFTT